MRFSGVEPNPATPDGFVVLPRTDKPIVLEQDEASHKNVTPPRQTGRKRPASLA